MLAPSNPGRDRRGAACLEMAICLPHLLMIVSGIVELGRMVEVIAILSAAAAEGGRQASIGALSDAQVAAVVGNQLASKGIPTRNLSVAVANLNNAAAGASGASQGDPLLVVVSLPTSDVRWVVMPYQWYTAATISAQSVRAAIRNPS